MIQILLRFAIALQDFFLVLFTADISLYLCQIHWRTAVTSLSLRQLHDRNAFYFDVIVLFVQCSQSNEKSVTDLLWLSILLTVMICVRCTFKDTTTSVHVHNLFFCCCLALKVRCRLSRENSYMNSILKGACMFLLNMLHDFRGGVGDRFSTDVEVWIGSESGQKVKIAKCYGKSPNSQPCICIGTIGMYVLHMHNCSHLFLLSLAFFSLS